MSTIVMSACWPIQTNTPVQKAVLMSMADNANDEGVCWPSIAYMVMRTCAAERTVQDAIKWLIEHGLVSKQERAGRSTVYTVTPANFAPPQNSHPRKSRTPANTAPPQEPHPTPAAAAPPPPQMPHPTPANAAPRTVIEPKEEPSGNSQEGAGAPSARPKPGKSKTPKPNGTLTADDLEAQGVDRQVALDWLSVRKAKDAPLTMTAWELVKSEAAKAGITAGEAVRVAAEHSWAGFKANWYANQKAEAATASAPVQDDLAWLKSWPSIVAKGNELGLRQGDGEAPPHFKVRVIKAANLTDEQKARARADHGVTL